LAPGYSDRPVSEAAHVPPESGGSIHHRRETCRACGEANLREFLDLGLQPLANAFLHSQAEFAAEPRYPLALYLCLCCGLVQLADVIDPAVLFASYIYVTGTSETIAAHNRGYAATVSNLLGLGPGDLVVETASNDGSLLTCFREFGVRVLGVEPAANIAELARSRGIPTETVFFNQPEAARLRESFGPARAVIGNNVLAHVDDPLGFLAGARALLAEDGLVIVEVPYLGDMIDRLEYDTVYHEHLCYFSVAALLRLAEGAGLRVVRIDRLMVHGGSLRLYAAAAATAPAHAPDVLALAELERGGGLTELARLRRFAAAVERHRSSLLTLLERLRGEGRGIAAYGAPAKGNTLLNYCGISAELVTFAVDRNPLKVGSFTPGMHLPVLPVETILERQPDFLLLLAWNFSEEIIRQQAEYSARGGKFILPLPLPQVLA
jgi:SAM-dependent methyltransferase